MAKIGILNYSLTSNSIHLKNVLKKLGYKVNFINKFNEFKSYDLIFNPGVGTFSNIMKLLKKKEFDKAIQDLNPNKKYLGICVGAQILFENGNEGFKKTNGLKILNGNIEKIRGKNPKIGYFKTKINKNYLFKNIQNLSEFYYLHGYAKKADDDTNEICTVRYDDIYYKSCFRIKNYTGVQFHPESSGKNGLIFLKNFVNE